MDRKDREVPRGTIRLSQSRILSDVQSPQKTQKQETTRDDSPHKRGQATNTSYYRNKASVRNDKGPIPKLHRKPKSSRSRARKPIFPTDTAPTSLADKAARHFHNLGRKPTVRSYRGRLRQCNSGWYGSSLPTA